VSATHHHIPQAQEPHRPRHVAVVARRRVTGRTVLDARPDALLGRIEAMSRAAWLALGRRALEDTPAAETRRRAEAALARVIVSCGLAVRAWQLRDDVETFACLANRARDAVTGRSFEVPCTDAERGLFAAARRLAANAALAELARFRLRPIDYAVLAAPLVDDDSA